MRNHDPTEDDKAARMMGRAIPHEPLQPFGPDEPLSADKQQAISRRLVDEGSPVISVR